MNEIFMFTGKLHFDKGGGTNRVILNRSRSLAEKGYNVFILTVADFNTEKIEQKLRKVGRLDSKVNHFNIYDFYKQLNTNQEITEFQKQYYKMALILNEPDYYIEINESKHSAKYYKSDECIKLKQWRKNGTLNYIDYYDNINHHIVREKYHKDNYINKKEFWKSNYMYKLQHFTSDGYCFLEIQYTEGNEKGEFYLYRRNTTNVQVFNSPDEFYTNWLNYICSTQEVKPYIICDKITFASSVINMKSDISYRIYAIHSNHLKSPFTIGSPKKLPHRYVLDHMKELDSLVLLTNKQKDDIINEFGDYNNTSVIPHSVPYIPDFKIEKDNRTISLVARLAPVKQISHSIIAFQRVVEKIPDARLEIYGLGKQKAELESKIKELKLENNIFLNGYSQETDIIYQRSLFTLLTSKSEAFALSILESMINGTPVISYNINYGPSDIIKNNKDGYLIDQDKDILADKIIYLLKRPRKAQKMGKRARRNALRKFDNNIITNKWINLFNSLKNKS